MGIAPLVAAIKRRPAHWKFGVPASAGTSALSLDGGDDGPIGLTVEIFINSAWTDISSYVYYRDRIKITRGKADETSQVQPQTASLTINNRDGRFSPRNPLSPYYGQIGRNTPIRIWRLNNGVRRYRFYGEVPTWPVTWDISGTDVYVRIQAAGPLRRVSQGSQPLGSAMYRALGLGLGLGLQVRPDAYWPCEDGEHSTQIASGLVGGSPMTLSGQALPTFASNSVFPCSAALPLLSGSIWKGEIPASAANVSNGIGFLMSIPETGAYDGGVLVRLYTTGTIARLDWIYGAVYGGSADLRGYDAAGNQLFSNGYQSPAFINGFTGFNGLPVLIDMTILVGGGAGNIDARAEFTALMPKTALNDTNTLWGGIIAGVIGKATRVVVNPDGHFNDTAIGHIVYSGTTNFYSGYTTFAAQLGGPLNAWSTEPPTSPLISPDIYGQQVIIPGGVISQGRFLRLCTEQNVQGAVAFATGVNAGDPATMGYQTSDTFPNLIQEPATANIGLLYEARDQNSLTLRERGTLYNQPARLILDYGLHQLSAPLNPIDDDALTRNDVTVSRVGGSSNRQTLTTGALSIQAPPNGVGNYATSYNVSLSSDSLLADQAGWRLHLGTVDEPRYPQINLNLRHPTFTSSIDMMNAALVLDIGDRVAINNPPPWMPPDAISQILQGYSETLGIFEHDMILNCSPESPYRVGILDDAVLGHADTDGSTLAGDYPLGTETTLLVSTTGAATGSPLWTTSAGDFPFDIAVGGERMTVTNITGASSPQTFTVTRSVNTVVKGQTSGTDVRLWQPMYTSV